MTHSTYPSKMFDRHLGHAKQAPAKRRRTRRLPPPDSATRVELDRPAALAPHHGRQRHPGGLVVAVGAIAIVAAIGSAVVALASLPLLAVVGVAAVGVLFAVLGTTEWHRRQDRASSTVGAHVEQSRPEIDLPSLTGQIGAVLTKLRQEHGVTYRSHTWIEDVLPSFGGPLKHPMLVRDLLAVAALDAGGIRADVARLAEAHDHDELVSAARTLHAHLQLVLDAWEGSAYLPAPPPSDQSGWLS